MARRERVGVLGGSFDPVHIGHLVLAVNAKHFFGLDRVLMIVAGHPWQKVGHQHVSPAQVRLAAVKAACSGVEGLEVSSIEVDRSGPSYTVDTLRDLVQESPDADFFLILGADAASRLDTWRDPAAVATLAQVIVANRPGTAVPQLEEPWQAHYLQIPPVDVSSTDLRRRLSEGLPVDFLVPKEALALFTSGR